MPQPSKVLETQYTMREGIDYTTARVRVDGKDVWIRVGGFKASKDAYPFLIAEAEMQARGATPMNGKCLNQR